MGSPDIGNAGKGYGDMMVVFDVDGTLFDTKEEIIRSLDIVLERYGIKKHLNIRRTGTESGSFRSLRASAHMRMYG